MVLLVAVLSMIVIAQAVVLYRVLRELRNAHVNLAAEVGVVRREGHKYTLDLVNKTITLLNIDRAALFEKSDAAHMDLAAEVGRYKAEVKSEFLGQMNCIEFNGQVIAAVKADLATSDAYAKSLNERLVLLEIEKPQKPAATEEPPPSRRSFASQKARAEAGARKT